MALTAENHESEPQRRVGRRSLHPITFHASAALLEEGARFNDEIHRMPTGQSTGIKKGLYRFKSFEAANQHQQDCLVDNIARLALERF